MTRRAFAIIVVAASACSGQTAEPRFDVATVKRAPATNDSLTHTRGGPGSSDPERVAYSNISLASALRIALGSLRPFQIKGPAWLTANRYEIVAKLPPGSTQAELQRMLLDLLLDRFHIAVHHESKNFDTYELTIAKNGPKLKESDFQPHATGQGESTFRPDPTRLPGLPASPNFIMALRADGPSRIAARAQSMADLVSRLEGFFRGVPVIDNTGLQGKYDFLVTFRASSEADPSGADIFLALQEQLGLKLEKRTAPFDVVVVDRANPQPSDD